MAKILDTSIRLGRVQSNREDDYISLEIEDEASGIHFLEIKLSMEQFGRLVGGTSNVKVKTTLRGLDNIGKKHETRQGAMFIDAIEYDSLVDSVPHHSREKILLKWMNEQPIPEGGWKISPYLGSRESIQFADGGKQINFRYYRYVDIEGNNEVNE